jgi:CRP-like cAMP-binding protein
MVFSVLAKPGYCASDACRLESRAAAGAWRRHWFAPAEVRPVVTAEEIAGIEVFAMLGPEQQERLARAAADVILASGEFAANEGDDRALFAVLEGRIEAVKTVDGVDRVVGERLPGDVFGEVPIVLGAPFPVGFRAAERSRVLRIQPAEYHQIAGSCAVFSTVATPPIGVAIDGLDPEPVGHAYISNRIRAPRGRSGRRDEHAAAISPVQVGSSASLHAL